MFLQREFSFINVPRYIDEKYLEKYQNADPSVDILYIMFSNRLFFIVCVPKLVYKKSSFKSTIAFVAVKSKCSSNNLNVPAACYQCYHVSAALGYGTVQHHHSIFPDHRSLFPHWWVIGLFQYLKAWVAWEYCWSRKRWMVVFPS